MAEIEELLPTQAKIHNFTYEDVVLKPDHLNYPFYITYDCLIILETFHPLYKQATHFLIAIAEPISRPLYIHEYRLTPYSLYAAVCVGLDYTEILKGLQTFCKNELPKSVSDFLVKCTKKCGKVRILVKNNCYYLEVDNCAAIVLKDDVIRRFCDEKDLQIFDLKTNTLDSELSEILLHDEANSSDIEKNGPLSTNYNPQSQYLNKNTVGSHTEHNFNPLGENKRQDLEAENYNPYDKSFEETKRFTCVKIKDVERIKNRCIELDYPPVEEFDFRSNKDKIETAPVTTLQNATNSLIYPVYGSFHVDLKPRVQIRSYQETCLNKMFSNGRARSGIIVLPCGAGKTLVGITAICTMKHPAIILCTSSVSVEQWKSQLIQYTDISTNEICLFTADKKDPLTSILITTYTMLAYTGKRSREAQKVIDAINNKVWGLLILDEVHVVPATMFRRVVSLRHYTKLGLTATLVREDDKIADLNFLIGPKLYEADWQSLSLAGHIAKVECFEVIAPMNYLFYNEYLKQSVRKRRVLAVINPGKFQICDYLIKKHENFGDKIIVFSDNVYALKLYALKLNKPFIYGPTGQLERMRILKQFQNNPNVNTIFLSKVGDTSIDLPEATCLIQISSHFGSRRQEAQRLGRILRAKKRNDPGFKVYFYSIVSKDTDEMYYSSKRQQFLIDQGYSFNVLEDVKNDSDIFKTKQEQKELLSSCLLNYEESEEENFDEMRTTKDLSNPEKMAYIDKKRKKNI